MNQSCGLTEKRKGAPIPPKRLYEQHEVTKRDVLLGFWAFALACNR